MAYEQRDNSGSLFKNDRKEKENQPDYTGESMIAGKMYRVSAWLKTSQSGKKFFSFSYTAKDAQPNLGNDSQTSQRAMPKPNSYAAATGKRDPISTGHLDRDLDDSVPF